MFDPEERPLIEDQCRMVMLMVILRAVEDYQLCLSHGYIVGNELVREKVYAPLNTNTKRLGLGLSEPSDIQSLIFFFHGGGLETTLEMARLNIESDCIRRAIKLPYGSIRGAFFGTTEANFSRCGVYEPPITDIGGYESDL